MQESKVVILLVVGHEALLLWVQPIMVLLLENCSYPVGILFEPSTFFFIVAFRKL